MLSFSILFLLILFNTSQCHDQKEVEGLGKYNNNKSEKWVSKYLTHHGCCKTWIKALDQLFCHELFISVFYIGVHLFNYWFEYSLPGVSFSWWNKTLQIEWFADNNWTCYGLESCYYVSVEIIVLKGEIAHLEHFLLFTQLSQESCAQSLKLKLLFGKGNVTWNLIQFYKFSQYYINVITKLIYTLGEKKRLLRYETFRLGTHNMRTSILNIANKKVNKMFNN